MQATITKLPIEGYEDVFEIKDEASTLHGFIAIHRTINGIALGGTRIFHYASEEEALNDALRLSKAMTFKAAFAKIPVGGGKGVIFAKNGKTKELLHAYGDARNQLSGKFTTGEDFGTTIEDIKVIKERQNMLWGPPDPSILPVWGVVYALKQP